MIPVDIPFLIMDGDRVGTCAGRVAVGGRWGSGPGESGLHFRTMVWLFHGLDFDGHRAGGWGNLGAAAARPVLFTSHVTWASPCLSESRSPCLYSAHMCSLHREAEMNI